MSGIRNPADLLTIALPAYKHRVILNVIHNIRTPQDTNSNPEPNPNPDPEDTDSDPDPNPNPNPNTDNSNSNFYSNPLYNNPNPNPNQINTNFHSNLSYTNTNPSTNPNPRWNDNNSNSNSGANNPDPNPGPLVYLEGTNEGRGSSSKVKDIKEEGSVAKHCTIGVVESPGSGRTVDGRSRNS